VRWKTVPQTSGCDRKMLCRRQRTDEYVEHPESLMRLNVRQNETNERDGTEFGDSLENFRIGHRVQAVNIIMKYAATHKMLLSVFDQPTEN